MLDRQVRVQIKLLVGKQMNNDSDNIFLIIIAFMIYKIFKHEFFGALCIFVVALIPLIQAFKYHYWYTILKEKKLLTVKDYFDKFRTEIK